MTDPVPSKDLVRDLVSSAYRDGYGADLTDDRDLSERTIELRRQLSKPAHEREPPHCKTCECWKADTQPAPEPAAAPEPLYGYWRCECGWCHRKDTYPTRCPSCQRARPDESQDRPAQPPGAGQ